MISALLRLAAAGSLFCVVVQHDAHAQTPNPVGQWQCVYGTGYIGRQTDSTVYLEYGVAVYQNQSFYAEGIDHGVPFQFQAQGQWRVFQDADGWWLELRGQNTNPILGTQPFIIHSVFVNNNQMSYSYQDESGMTIVSQCQRTG